MFLHKYDLKYNLLSIQVLKLDKQISVKLVNNNNIILDAVKKSIWKFTILLLLEKQTMLIIGSE